MDCTPFIRTKLLLTTWIVAPILLLVIAEMTIRGFRDQQKTVYDQKTALTKMVPRMQEELESTARFLKTYQVDFTGKGSAQDLYISLLNAAAASAKFSLETVSINQEPISEDLGTIRLVMSLEGSGTSKQIARFLQKIKKSDPMIYTRTLVMNPDGRASDKFQITADLMKIYTENVK